MLINWIRSCEQPRLVGAKEAFGPNLKRIRVQRGVSLERISLETKVGVDVWESMERNDFTGWPSGIFARAYVRAYAMAIDVDPESTVDEFCRWFPLGDRRAAPIIRGQAEIVGHVLQWTDKVPPSAKHGERRASNLPLEPGSMAAQGWPGRFGPLGHMIGRLRRTFERALHPLAAVVARAARH
jgi:helix-turn-helix protein